jgi:hypothetical protein
VVENNVAAPGGLAGVAGDADSVHEGTPRRLDGNYHSVQVYDREYKAGNGLMLPYLLETKVH